MIVYPAIDIRGGRCVRLSQGRDDARTNYYEDPVEPAVQFTQAGAEWIHAAPAWAKTMAGSTGSL